MFKHSSNKTNLQKLSDKPRLDSNSPFITNFANFVQLFETVHHEAREVQVG